jgi:hypothetical protein
MTINQFMDQGFIDKQYLDSLPIIAETNMIKHVQAKSPLQIIVDGQKRTGVILKEGYVAVK